MTFISIVFENVYMVKLVHVLGSSSTFGLGRVWGHENTCLQFWVFFVHEIKFQLGFSLRFCGFVKEGSLGISDLIFG